MLVVRSFVVPWHFAPLFVWCHNNTYSEFSHFSPPNAMRCKSKMFSFKLDNCCLRPLRNGQTPGPPQPPPPPPPTQIPDPPEPTQPPRPTQPPLPPWLTRPPIWTRTTRPTRPPTPFRPPTVQPPGPPSGEQRFLFTRARSHYCCNFVTKFSSRRQLTCFAGGLLVILVVHRGHLWECPGLL